jgi:hypothetical protein
VSSTEAPISITVKSTAGSLITVRAETGEQLDNLVAEALAAITSAVTELEAAAKNSHSPAPMSATQVAASLGASIVDTTPAPAQDVGWGSPSTSAPSIAGGRNCPHGKMTAIQGTGKDGRLYRGYFCAAPKGALDKCKNVYARVGTPEWNTFVPDQVK